MEHRSRVLVITSLIPTELIKHKENENDILFITEDAILKTRSEIQFTYVFVFPYINYLLKFASKKWESYYTLRKKKYFKSFGRKVFTLPYFMTRYRPGLRFIYYQFAFFLNRRRIKHIIEEFSPTIIHAHNADEQAYIARMISIKYKIPYIVTVRSTSKVDKLVLDNLKNAKLNILLSNNIPNIEKLYGIRNFQIIPHGLEQDSFVPIEHVYKKPDNDKLRLITVSRLLPYKNLDFIIQSLADISSLIDFEYYIYGEGPEFLFLKELIVQLNLENRVFLKGRIPHNRVREELYKSDLFILLSYPETFGRVYIEAMAAGVPFIGLEKTGVYGLVKANDEGLFCTKDNLKEVLLSIITDKSRLKILRINSRLAADRFKWEYVSMEIYDIYMRYGD